MKTKIHTGTEGLELFAKIFFSMPVKQQEDWTQDRWGVSARTFRRWCKNNNINVVKTVVNTSN